MLELICQQRYRVGGVPVDVSPYGNHGQAIDAAVAAGPGHDAIHFPNADSRVVIGPGKSSAWSPLIALKIEAVVRVDTSAARELAIAAGDGAFQFLITEHALTGFVAGVQIRSADADSPDGQMHVVPPNRWTTLTLEHDGYARLRLSIDGRLVAEKAVSGGVPAVGAGGVAVGNLTAGGRPLKGDIDEISIWRLDPRSFKREFLGRHMDPDTVRCWLKAIAAARQWATQHPAQAKTLVDLSEAQSRAAIRSLLLAPAADQDHLRADVDAMMKLWFEGGIGSPEMSHLTERWFKGLHRLGLAPNGAAAEVEAVMAGLAPPKVSIDCDPAIQSYLKHMRKAVDALPGKGR
jgi:hypothetical protein